MILGFPRAKQGLFHYDIWRGDPSLIRYSCKTDEQNFMKLSGIVQHMMPYCTSYFKFLSIWFWGVPQQTRTLPLRHIGGGDPSLIRYSCKTDEQNFMKLSGIVYYVMPYCTSYFKFLFEWFLGFPRAKQGLCHTKHGGAGSIILWALLTVFLVLN